MSARRWAARRRRRAGFSVLEVIVAVALFSIGIVSVFLIFRPGLDTLRMSGDVLRAVRIAEEEAERLKQNAGQLPEAIVALGPQGEVLPYDPPDLTPVWGNPNWAPESIHRPRTIIGERVSIQRQTRLALPTFTFTPDHVSAELFESAGVGDRVLRVEGASLFTIGTTARLRHPDYDPGDVTRQNWDFPLGIVLAIDPEAGLVEVQLPIPDVGQSEMPPGSKLYGPGLVVIYSEDEMRRTGTPVGLLAERGGPDELDTFFLRDTTGEVLFNPSDSDRFVKFDYSWVKTGVPLRSETRVNDGRADLLTPVEPVRRPQPGVYWVPAGISFTEEVGGVPVGFATVGDPKSGGVNRPLGDAGAGRVEAAMLRAADGTLTVFNSEFSGVLPNTVSAFNALHGDGLRFGGALASGHYEIISADLHFATAFIEFSPADAGRQVKMDYRAADWSLLREEQVIDPTGEVTLRLDDLKGPNVRTPPRMPVPQPVLVEDGVSHFVVAVEPVSGQVLLDGRDFTVDYRRGLVSGLEAFAGQRLRFFYRTRQDWLVQVFKPKSLYTRGQMVQANQFYMLDARTMLFQRTDAGSTLLVDYRAQDGRFISGEVVQLKPSADGARGILSSPVDDGGLMLARGVSVRVRVAWAGDGRTVAVPPAGFEGAGTLPFNARWRARQVELFITRRETSLP